MQTAAQLETWESINKIAELMSEPKKIDWEQRKWELVCHVAQGLYAGQHSWSPQEAVQWAEDIIAAYKAQTPESNIL